jgi:DNA-binding transcriptional LysR family regulator
MFENKEYVYEVYKERSFSKAAENLFISQPSLSLTIKKVESKIGTKLFDRSTTPIQLTESGMEYIKCTERIMDIENEFQCFLSELNELKVGSLTIGASNFFTSYILPPYITRFMSKYPMVKVNLVEADTVTLEKRLFAGDLDLIVENCSLDETIYKKLHFYKEQMILAVPEILLKNKAAKKYRLTANDIIRDLHKKSWTAAVPLKLFEDVPFILLRHGNDTRNRADLIFEEQGIHPKIILELDQLATAYNTACHGLGATLVSDTLVKKTLPDSRIAYYKIDGQNVERENYFYHKINKYITRAMQKFFDLTQVQEF